MDNLPKNRIDCSKILWKRGGGFKIRSKALIENIKIMMKKDRCKENDDIR